MLILAASRARGFSLVELLVVVAVLGLVLFIGLPNMSAWLQNTQVRNAADGMMSGLQLARAEALRRNQAVRFQLVSDLTSGCALSATGGSWIVSLGDPTAACDAAPSETAGPQIIQKKDAQEGSPNATVTTSGGAEVIFNGLGRPTAASTASQITVSNSAAGTCQHLGGTVRCLEIQIQAGGDVRMCDRAVTDPTDPRRC
jgi:type IV fimbrial biogenesis protein FimT